MSLPAGEKTVDFLQQKRDLVRVKRAIAAENPDARCVGQILDIHDWHLNLFFTDSTGWRQTSTAYGVSP